jgi:hypothetical protein
MIEHFIAIYDSIVVSIDGVKKYIKREIKKFLVKLLWALNSNRFILHNSVCASFVCQFLNYNKFKANLLVALLVSTKKKLLFDFIFGYFHSVLQKACCFDIYFTNPKYYFLDSKYNVYKVILGFPLFFYKIGFVWGQYKWYV